MSELYSRTVIDHAMNPRNVGNIEAADGYASVTGPCGDTMEIWLKVKDGTIVKATFITDGCGTVSQALRTSQEDVLSALGGLPEESQHCALLAANTLQAAVRDYLVILKEPWKRLYGRR